ncbi:hypothetical protein ACUNWD_12175 [Sunxiuqinia sp. A32]|uniref:hypothetical protein n=1 Tax=Sunxiuqinia sp. A32 TaxID=3461496 RepID=UPI0040466141
MNPLMKRFLLRTSVLTSTFFLSGYVLYTQIIPEYYVSSLPFALLFFYLVTNLVHFYLLKIADKDMPKFAPRFMGTSFLKMLVYLIFGIVIALFNREEAKVFLANFLFMYICFSVLEVYEITRVVKSKKLD